MSSSQIKLLPHYEQLEFTASTKLICKNQNVTSHNAKPSKRYGHLSFIYKGKLYVQGGHSNQGKNHSYDDSKSNIYCINLEKDKMPLVQDKKTKKSSEPIEGKWEVIQAKFTPAAEAQFQLFAFQAFCIFPHKRRLYMFGGTTIQGKTSNNLFRLDLDSLQWSKPEQKGTTPKARQDAAMTLFTKNEKNYLVLYGGANFETYEIFSDLHFYQIQTKYWFQCHNLSSNFIQPRLNPGICFNENKIYIFGGYYVDTHHRKGYFNDLYEIEFNLSVEKGRPYGRSFSRRLDEISSALMEQKQQTRIQPQGRCSTQLLFYKAELYQLSPFNSYTRRQTKMASSWLLLIAGEKACEQKKKVITFNDVWIFSFFQMRWKSVNMLSDFKPRSSFTAVLDKQMSKIVIFGGLSNLQYVLNDLVSLKVICKKIQEDGRNLGSKEVTEQKQLFKNSFQLQGFLIEQMCDSINFPFAGIGLIMDNFVSFQAQFCDISYHISKSKPVCQNYIKFESNARFIMPNETLFSSFACLKGGIRTYVQGTDKKIKAQMYKDNLSKQIGTNFVIGGLRIGDQIIFLNLNQQSLEIQIMVVFKLPQMDLPRQTQNQDRTFHDNKIKFYYFVISRQQIITQEPFNTSKSSQQSKKRKHFFDNQCPNDSKERIRMLITQGINTIKKGQVKNLFYISKLHTVNNLEINLNTKQQQLELFPDMMKNDLIFGDRQIIAQIQKNKIAVYQCMDVSLRSYLSYLYVHCDTQITLAIHGLEKKQILVQQYILKIDQFLKSKQIVEISDQFQFDCKIIQLYYFTDRQPAFTPKPDNNFFANGTLYYHKSRLIKRHGVSLGDYCLQYKLKSLKEEVKRQSDKYLPNKMTSYYNNAQIFGHIQLPQSVPVNSTKTQFIFPVMLQKVDQKLRLMQDQVKQDKEVKKKEKASKKQ